jgi:hypothetical protein
MRIVENEKEKLYSKLKDLQDENMELKTKLINIKNSHYNQNSLSNSTNFNNNGSMTDTGTNSFHSNKINSNNNNNNSNCYQSSPANTSGQFDEKDYEIAKLKRIIDDLIKSNEEKVNL